MTPFHVSNDNNHACRQLSSLHLDDIKELIKKRNLLTKEIDDLSKPVDVLCMHESTH